MWIAKRQGFGGDWDYFQDNYDDSPKWTKDKNRAFKFGDKQTAFTQSNLTGLYEIVLEKVDFDNPHQ